MTSLKLLIPRHMKQYRVITDDIPASAETMLKKDDDQSQLAVGPVSDKLLIYPITKEDTDFSGLGVEPKHFLILRDFLRSNGDKIQEMQSVQGNDPMEKPSDDILEELTFEKLTEKFYSNNRVGNGESYLGRLRSEETEQIRLLTNLCYYRQHYKALPYDDQDDQLFRQFIRDWLLEVDIDHQLLREEINSLMHKYKQLKKTDQQGTHNAFVTLGDKIWQADDH